MVLTFGLVVLSSSQHMLNDRLAKLKRLGLSAAEAQIYLALLRNGGPLGATALADKLDVQRTTVYPLLTSLTQKGMVEAEAGYGSAFGAVRADRALPGLLEREREQLAERARLAQEEHRQRQSLVDELTKQLKSLSVPTEHNGESELIQVLRDPRVIAERFERLELEAKWQIEAFVKPPAFVRVGNPAQKKAQKRGVRIRGLYERAVVEAPNVKPYLGKWMADGEEARVHDGELPHKLAIFDRQHVLMPLVTPDGAGKTLYVRHPQLALSLGMLFDFLWELAEPIPNDANKSINAAKKNLPKEAINERRPRVRPQIFSGAE